MLQVRQHPLQGGDIKFSWTNNAGAGKAKDSDNSILVVYCPFYNQSIYNTDGAIRSASGTTLNVSPFVGQAVETYISFIDNAGKETATSLYTGHLTIT